MNSTWLKLKVEGHCFCCEIIWMWLKLRKRHHLPVSLSVPPLEPIWGFRVYADWLSLPSMDISRILTLCSSTSSYWSEFLVLPNAWACVFLSCDRITPFLLCFFLNKILLIEKKTDNIWLRVATMRDSLIWIWCCLARFFLWLCLASPQTPIFLHLLVSVCLCAPYFHLMCLARYCVVKSLLLCGDLSKLLAVFTRIS